MFLLFNRLTQRYYKDGREMKFITGEEIKEVRCLSFNVDPKKNKGKSNDRKNAVA